MTVPPLSGCSAGHVRRRSGSGYEKLFPGYLLKPIPPPTVAVAEPGRVSRPGNQDRALFTLPEHAFRSALAG